MLKVAITGASGLIGSRIIELLSDDFQFVPLSHREMDITNIDQVKSTLSDIDFDVFLHLAGYTKVDQAELEKETAYQINVLGTQNIFETIKTLQRKMIYVSTDFVFDGQDPPYIETSQPHPISIYGQTKYQGERVLDREAMIVRISYPYRAKFDLKKDFFRTIKSLLEQEKPLTMVSDSLMTPTFIDDIAYSLKDLFENFSPEIFHIVGRNTLSPYEAGKTIARIFNLREDLIKPITYDEYFKGKAKRPKLADMKTKKNRYFKMKSFEEGLQIIKKNQI